MLEIITNQTVEKKTWGAVESAIKAICYVCEKKVIKGKMQYIGWDKWRCKKCFAGSKSWLKSDAGKKSILSKHFEPAVAVEDKTHKKGGEKEMKMFVREDKEKCLWSWYTYPEGERIDFINVSPAEYIGYDESIRKEVSIDLAAALKDVVGVQEKQAYKDKPTILIYTLVTNQKKEKEEAKMTAKKKAVKVEAPVKEEEQKKIEAEKDVKKKKKKFGVGALVRGMIKDKNAYEKIEGAVRKEFPESKFNKAHYAWYKKNM